MTLPLIILAIPNSAKTVIMIVLMILVFYFFLIRPQSQQRKKEQEYRDSLKKGDRVMTLGGIHGTIHNTMPGYVELEVAPGVRMKVGKSNITPIPTPKEKK